MAAGGRCNEDIAMNIKRIGEQQLVRKAHCFPIWYFVTYATTYREVIIIPTVTYFFPEDERRISEILHEKIFFLLECR